MNTRSVFLLLVTGNKAMGKLIHQETCIDWNTPIGKIALCPFEGPNVLEGTGDFDDCEFEMEWLSTQLEYTVENHLALGHQSFVVFLESQLGALGVETTIHVDRLIRCLDYPKIAGATGEACEDVRARVKLIAGLGTHEAIYAEIRQWLVSFQ